MKLLCLILVLLLVSCNNNEKNLLSLRKDGEEPIEKTQTYSREKVLGEAFTPIIDRGQNRITNIRIACSSISGKTLNSGDVFSFNELTGARSAENGYKSAPVMVDGKTSYGIGGGVCQVSTTIYQAALDASLKIEEHHFHSEKVAYAPENTDATVVYGLKDLKFRNNIQQKIQVYTWIQDEKVYAKIVTFND